MNCALQAPQPWPRRMVPPKAFGSGGGELEASGVSWKHLVVGWFGGVEALAFEESG